MSLSGQTNTYLPPTLDGLNIIEADEIFVDGVPIDTQTFVPYLGATKDVNIGSFSFETLGQVRASEHVLSPFESTMMTGPTASSIFTADSWLLNNTVDISSLGGGSFLSTSYLRFRDATNHSTLLTLQSDGIADFATTKVRVSTLASNQYDVVNLSTLTNAVAFIDNVNALNYVPYQNARETLNMGGSTIQTTGLINAGALRITSSVSNDNYSLSVNQYDQLEIRNLTTGNALVTGGDSLAILNINAGGLITTGDIQIAGNSYLYGSGTVEWRQTALSDDYEIKDDVGDTRLRLSKATGLTISTLNVTQVPSATPTLALGVNGSGGVVSFAVPTSGSGTVNTSTLTARFLPYLSTGTTLTNSLLNQIDNDSIGLGFTTLPNYPFAGSKNIYVNGEGFYGGVTAMAGTFGRNTNTSVPANEINFGNGGSGVFVSQIKSHTGSSPFADATWSYSNPTATPFSANTGNVVLACGTLTVAATPGGFNALCPIFGTTTITAGTTVQSGPINARVNLGRAIQPGEKGMTLRYDQANNLASIQSEEQGVAFRSLLLNPGGGNVGIGVTTAPTAALQVQDVIRFGNYSGGNYDNIQFMRGTGSGQYPNIRCQENYIAMYVSDAGGWLAGSQVGDMVIRLNTGENLRMGVGSNAGLVLNSSNDVIVSNNLTAAANLTGGSLIVNGGGSYVAGCLYSDSNWGMLIRAKVPGAIAEFDFRNSAETTRMRITSDGRVNISQRLTVGGANSSGVIDIVNPNGSYTHLGWTDNNNYFRGVNNMFDCPITLNSSPAGLPRIQSPNNVRSIRFDDSQILTYIINGSGPTPVPFTHSSWAVGGYTLFSKTTGLNTMGLAIGISDYRSVIISLAPAIIWGELILSGGTIYTSCNGTINLYTAGGGWVFVSDKRCKRDIKDIKTTRSLERIMALKPKTYKKIYPENPETPIPQKVRDADHIGFIAQDVMKTNPHCIDEWVDDKCVCDDDDGKRLGIAYGDINVHMVGAIQEIVKQNTAQQAEIEDLKKQLAKITALLQTLE